jgi:hypothetical protein
VTVGCSRLQTISVFIRQLGFVKLTFGVDIAKRKSLKKIKKLINFRKMSSDREQNGPTQVHPSLNFNDMNTHIQMNMNGINGMNGMSKSFGEYLFNINQEKKYKKLEENFSQNLSVKFSLVTMSMRKNFHENSPCRICVFVKWIKLDCHSFHAFKIEHFNLLANCCQYSA